MAQKKSKADILRSEKYMDDAVFSAFFNLHKAAKRKNEYIWATERFNSLDSIWGDPVQLENDTVLDDTSKVRKNPKYESKISKQQYCGIDNKQSTSQVHECNPVEVIMPDNARKTGWHHEQTPKVSLDDTSKNTKYDSKILKQQYCGIDNEQSTSKVHECNPVEVIMPDNARKTGLHHEQTPKVSQDDTSKVSKNPKYDSIILKQQYCGIDNKESTSQVHECNPVEVIMPDNARKTGLHHGQTLKVSESRKASLLQNFGDSNEGKGNKSKYSNPANKVLNAGEQCEIRAIRETLKGSTDIYCRISDTRYKWRREISQREQNFRSTGTLETENHSQYIFGDAEKTSRLTFENCRFNVASNAEKNGGVKSHNGETEFQSRHIKSKSDKPRREKAIERVKRKRYMSFSVNSLLPEHKHSISIENQKHDTVDKRRVMLKYLQLKIFKGEKVFDFTLELSDFNRMKKRLPKLEEVLPEIDGDEKELNYSADAVKIVLGFLRNLRYPTPDERTAIEVLAASKSWEMYQFHDEFKQKFSDNLNINNVRLAYGAAVHYGLTEICDAYKCAFSDDLPINDRPYRPRKCYVSVSTYIEPREFCIPSNISTSTLQDNFNKDIRNEIRFKAITGSYVITGFHILLDIDNENETDSINLEFIYVVRNFKSSYEEELKVHKPLRRNIVIHLKRSLVVNQNETAEIVVESSIKPYLCFSIQENNFVGRCDESQFSLNVMSTYKVKNSNEKRFLIGKLLYYPKT